MSAETGVGPAIASGSQTKSGICALLPVHPRKRKSPPTVAIEPRAAPPKLSGVLMPGAAALMAENSKEPAAPTRMNMPMMTPKSPIRLAMNAFLPASA